MAETLLVFASSGDPAARAAFDAGRLPLDTLPREPLARPGELAATTNETGDVISFRTDRVGEPHIVKVSWFPNWKVEARRGHGCCHPR